MLNELDINYNQLLTTTVLSILARNCHDTTLTRVNYNGITLPANLLGDLTNAIDFNESHNRTEQLSVAFEQGDCLKILEPMLAVQFPIKKAEDVAAFASTSRAQERAFVYGWKARNNVIINRTRSTADTPAAATSTAKFTK